ncbi:MAG: SAM-dependent methyltransferase [Planctomycetota bacterium]
MSPTDSSPSGFVSRGGEKLSAAIEHFQLVVRDMVCADFGSHVGGFVDCLLQRGAARVYSVDTSYGTLAWKLRKDLRVVVLERANAMHVELPEIVNLVTVDVGWTPQAKVLPAAANAVRRDGMVLTLVKPHYEAAKDRLIAGVLPDEAVDGVVAGVLDEAARTGWQVVGTFDSVIRGHGGNREVFALLRRVW